MQDIATTPFSPWENFYVIVGSSAAALTGLQFVVMALVADQERVDGGPETIGAFGTPTIVHFCAVLLMSGILSAPWRGLEPAAWLLTVVGVAGVIYGAIVVYRARHQHGYKPVLEDWVFHAILPIVAYTALLVGGALMRRESTDALFGVAASALLLLFVGIHNAWDTVTYIVTTRTPAPKDGS